MVNHCNKILADVLAKSRNKGTLVDLLNNIKVSHVLTFPEDRTGDIDLATLAFCLFSDKYLMGVLLEDSGDRILLGEILDRARATYIKAHAPNKVGITLASHIASVS
jgi:hypothetical protein